ncbi:MAG: MATE family efflux transporter [Planctomycetes bacterium]|nr:MATE family efflux transporter [Planctomycetota bacterium]
MVGNLSQIFVSLVDTWFLGKVGSDELAAMAQAGVAYLIIFLAFSAPFMGIQALVARRFGEGREAACGEIFNTGLMLQVLLGLSAGLIGAFFMPQIAGFLFGGRQDLGRVVELSAGYLAIRVGGMVAMTTLWALRGFLYGIGITKPDLLAGLAMNLFNVLFNTMFIFGRFGAPRMGMQGAALASVLATALVTLGTVVYVARPVLRSRFGLFRLEFRAPVLRSIFKLSGPRAMQAIAFGGSIYFFKLIGDSCGREALAASIVVWRWFGIAVLVAVALGAAAATIVGQQLGAGQPEEAERGAWAAVRIGLVINGGLALVSLVAPETILGLFSDDPTVIAMGLAPMRFMALFQVVDAIGIVLGRALGAAGCALYVMTAEIVVSLGLMAPAAYLMSRFQTGNLLAMWGAWAVYVSCWAIAMTLKFRRAGWKAMRI